MKRKSSKPSKVKSTRKARRPVTPSVPATHPFKLHYAVIAPLIMGKGVGDGKTTSCVMAQAATIDALRKGRTLAKPTDEMDCACRFLRGIAINLNDIDWWESDEERTTHLRPLIPMLLDSAASLATTKRRAARLTDNVVRELTPMRLECIASKTDNADLKAKCLTDAARLRALAPIVDDETGKAAQQLTNGLERSFNAYANANANAYAYANANANANAYAYANANAYANAYAYAYAYANANAKGDKAQARRFRDMAIALFVELAAMKDEAA